MTNAHDGTLTLDAVVRSFSEADEQLRLAADRIKSLAIHEENTARATASLETTASSVAELVTRAEDAMGVLRDSLGLASRSLEAGAALLDSAVLVDLQRQVNAVTEAIARIDEQARTADERTTAGISSMTDSLDMVGSSVSDQIESVKATQASHADEMKKLGYSVGRLGLVGFTIAVLQIAAIVILLVK
ncbi:MAG: hypothetical protein WD942_05460 [Dehalococcoidia bacterium]